MPLSQPEVTVITATWRRPKDVWRIMEALQLQDLLHDLGSLRIEHLVVTDGPADRQTRRSVKAFDVHPRICRRLLELPLREGQFGAACKDLGLQAATGGAVVFWDDDNWFYPHALRTLWHMLETGAQVGIAQLRHNAQGFRPVPAVERWQAAGQTMRLGNIDTGCFILPTALAKTGFWCDQAGAGSDYRYYDRVTKSVPPEKIVFQPIVIGVHL